ncbi:MAG: HD domain-containing protein [Parachlamydiaceae bacterium]|nr:HD domain-containing protein [Parachlamydiaceae bacterium]
MHEIVNLLNEIGMLSHIPRSGFAFLGSGKQSVAEHSYRVALIAHALARLSSKASDKTIDHSKLIMMCLLHDLPEARTGDLNYLQKKYVHTDLPKAINDIEKGSPLGPEIAEWINEYEDDLTEEAKIAHDADQLELFLVLKKEHELGNPRALEWFKTGCKRLKTPIAKELAEMIFQTSSDEWWFGDKEDVHWIDGGKLKKENKKE